MLLNLVIVLLLLGAILYVISVVPLDPTIKTVIHVVLIVAALIYLLVVFAAPVLEKRGIM